MCAPIRIPTYAILACVCMCTPVLAQDIVIGGTVLDRRMGGPIAGATIRLVALDGQLIDTTFTDASGMWWYRFAQTGTTAQATTAPALFTLEQNYPNPFNPSTHIPFSIGRRGLVRLTAHNVLGQLVDAREQELGAGDYRVEWTASGSAGVLFYSIETAGRRLTRKMVQLDGHGQGGFGTIRGVAGTIRAFRWSSPADSVHVIASSLLYEPDTVQIARVNGSRAEQRLTTVHDAAFLIDLHDDVLEQIAGSGFTYQIGVRNSTHQTDIPRLRDGGADAMCFSVWIDPSLTPYYPTTVRYLDSLLSQFRVNAADISVATTTDSIAMLQRQGRIAAVLLVEGGHCIEDDLEKLKDLYRRGMRVMTITWNNSTSWAVSAADRRSATVGLSEFGRQVIRTLDSLGVVIDVSHVGKKTIEDILSVTTHPIIASHSGAAAIRNHYRNLTDEQLRAIAATGGVVGIDFYPPFLTSNGTATIATVIQHIDYIRTLIGIDYLAIGSDFDGFSSSPVVGLENVSRYPALTEALLRHGYSREDVRKILGENFLRVFRSVAN